MRYLISGLLVATLFISGCSTIISEQSRRQINTAAPFRTLKETPDKFIGKNILLGGRIANIRNSTDGAHIEIVQFDLTSQGYPEESFLSYGRFLAISSSYMEPLIFRQGMLLTLVGEIKGKKTLRLDGMDYTYPVISMIEWYLWPGSGPDRTCIFPMAPPQYDPYSYGFGYEPLLLRPYSPLYLPR